MPDTGYQIPASGIRYSKFLCLFAAISNINGNPLKDITVIGANKEWFTAPPREKGIETIRLIMKDGKIYKTTL
jgi:hypothetical protein